MERTLLLKQVAKLEKRQQELKENMLKVTKMCEWLMGCIEQNKANLVEHPYSKKAKEALKNNEEWVKNYTEIYERDNYWLEITNQELARIKEEMRLN